MPQIPITNQVGKLEKDVTGEGRMCRAAPFWGQFSCSGPWRPYNTKECRHGNEVKEQASPVEGDQDHWKTLKTPPITIKVQKSTYTDSFTWRARNLIQAEENLPITRKPHKALVMHHPGPGYPVGWIDPGSRTAELLSSATWSPFHFLFLPSLLLLFLLLLETRGKTWISMPSVQFASKISWASFGPLWFLSFSDECWVLPSMQEWDLTDGNTGLPCEKCMEVGVTSQQENE